MRAILNFLAKIKTKILAAAGREMKHPLVWHAVVFFVMPALLLGVLGLMHITNGNAILLFFASPYFWVKILISYAFVLSVQCFLWSITQRGSIAVVANTVLFFVLGFVTEVMISITGDPLLPTDILMVGDLGAITSFVRIPFIPFAVLAGVIAVLVILGYLLWHKHAKRAKIRWWQRTIAILLGISFFAANVYFVCVDYDFRHATLKKFDVDIAAFNPVDDYRKNGLVLEFFPRIGDMFVGKMDGYSANKIAISENAFSGEDYFKASEVQPNIICIQSEAWWDVYEMKETDFNVDPMKNIRKLARGKNVRMGKMATSVYGGGTCLPEFEALTGLNCRYLLSNGYPYVQYITSETPSVVSALRNGGYQTVAFHPYHKNFYSRNRAYPLMGFDAFYGMDDMDNAEKSGWYISDMAVTDFIIDTYLRKKDGPLFMFTVTMQNHGGYTPSRYKEYDVELNNPGLDDAGNAELLDFAQGVYEADQAFQALVDYFKNADEPTVIVMYGDHLPLLGIEGNIYREGGYVEDTLPFVSSEHEILHKTPYIAWANYNADLRGFNKTLSAGKIGLEVLRVSGIENVPPYFNTLYALYEELPVINPYFIYDKKGRKYENVPERLKANENAFRYIQYDLLHGKHYVSR